MATDPRLSGPPPRAGELLHITRAASVQFIRPFRFRVIRTIDRDTYYGWVWLDGYQLNAAGDAECRREIFVQLAGLPRVAEQPRTRNVRARNGSASGRPSRRAAPRARPQLASSFT